MDVTRDVAAQASLQQHRVESGARDWLKIHGAQREFSNYIKEAELAAGQAPVVDNEIENQNELEIFAFSNEKSDESEIRDGSGMRRVGDTNGAIAAEAVMPRRDPRTGVARREHRPLYETVTASPQGVTDIGAEAVSADGISHPPAVWSSFTATTQTQMSFAFNDERVFGWNGERGGGWRGARGSVDKPGGGGRADKLGRSKFGQLEYILRTTSSRNGENAEKEGVMNSKLKAMLEKGIGSKDKVC